VESKVVSAVLVAALLGGCAELNYLPNSILAVADNPKDRFVPVEWPITQQLVSSPVYRSEEMWELAYPPNADILVYYPRPPVPLYQQGAMPLPIAPIAYEQPVIELYYERGRPLLREPIRATARPPLRSPELRQDLRLSGGPSRGGELRKGPSRGVRAPALKSKKK
jgi:hypothetical protein